MLLLHKEPNLPWQAHHSRGVQEMHRVILRVGMPKLPYELGCLQILRVRLQVSLVWVPIQ